MGAGSTAHRKSAAQHPRHETASDGYRFAKSQGKPNFAIGWLSAQNADFCDSAGVSAGTRLRPIHRNT
jgi:hypothetical protein